MWIPVALLALHGSGRATWAVVTSIAAPSSLLCHHLRNREHERARVPPERFETHRAHLRSIAYRMLGSQTEADDAVQDVAASRPQRPHGRREPRGMANYRRIARVPRPTARASLPSRGINRIAASGRCTCAGATVKEPAQDVGGGRLVATVTDPDGNVLGLLQDQ